MKVAIVTRYPKLILPILKHHVVLSNENPDIVVSLGGDGTFLEAEEKFPGVPKVLINYHKGDRFEKRELSIVISNLLKRKYKVTSETKVEADVRGKKLVGLNEINIHYKPPQAIRLAVLVDGKEIGGKEIIGDGVVISTPYGSTAYFHSITGKTFSKGLGLAFNNPTKCMKPKILKNDSEVKVKVLRGKGTVTADCCKNVMEISKGDTVTIRRHPKTAKILHLRGHKRKIKCG